MKKIDMDLLVDGEAYRIRSRNLVVGVWRADRRGFIGIRNKFGSDYLFTEFHHDADPYVGTVNGMEPLGVRVPDGVDLTEGHSLCQAFMSNSRYELVCNHPTEWVPAEKGPGRWEHVDKTLDEDHPTRSVYSHNSALFDFLVPLRDQVVEQMLAEEAEEALERESRRWAPQTYQEHVREALVAKANEWRRARMDEGVPFLEVADEWHQMLKAATTEAAKAVPGEKP